MKFIQHLFLVLITIFFGKMGYAQFSVDLDTLLPGDTLLIIYDVKINDNITSHVVSNQCVLTADGGINKKSDDPDTGSSDDATKTTVYLPLTLTTYNELTFGDPCHCADTLNCRDNGTLYFHDSLVIPASFMTTPGLNIRIESATNFYLDVPCNGGTLTPITPSGNNSSVGTQIPEVPPGSGVYKLKFWKPEDLQPTLVVDAYNGAIQVINDQAAPPETFQPLCTAAACNSEPIPTLGEWGIILLSLIMLILGIVGLRAKEFDDYSI